ncbi:ATP-grasp domain-containing protein [Clavibacter sp. Sh2036]|uniref:ATP-grasp domain-containing protein n=1 Tax=Clavibacter sp. Sh2036 TaxID=3397677 RepID=UPI0039E14114
MSTILALGAGGAGGHVADWSRRLAMEAEARGHRLLVVDRAENLVGAEIVRNPRHEVVAADFADVSAVRTALVGRPTPDAVVGFREHSLITTALLAEEAGAPWNGSAQVAACRQKDTTREILRAAGLPQPRVEAFASVEEAVEHLRHAELPRIVKPRDAFGSQGVRLVRAPGEIAEAVLAAAAFSDRILVEEYVLGREVSVEGVMLGGEPRILEVTGKSVTAPPVFVELGHRQPSGLTEQEEDKVRSTAARAVTAVGLTHSLFHVEAWVTADGAVVCGEVHARLGGDWIHALIAHRRPGIELFGMVLDDVLGGPSPVSVPAPDPGRAAAVVGVVAPHAGTVTAIHRGAGLVGGTILHEDWAVRVGDRVAGPRDSFGRAGLVVVGTDDPEHLDRLVRQVRADVRIEVAG